MPTDPSPKLEIDWRKTAAGAFAAVSSAFLLSTLGAAGTIIGAALGSVIVTVGGALYTQGLARSQQRLAQVQSAAMRKVGVAQADVRRAARRPGDDEAVDGDLAHADERLGEVKDELGAMVEEPTDADWRERFVMLPWKRIALVAAGLFAAAILAITAFELVAGKSLSSLTGGSDGDGRPTIGRIVGGSEGDTSNDDNRPPSNDEQTPSDSPSDEPSDQPSDQPSSTDTPTSEPTPTPETSAPVPTPTAPATSEPPQPSTSATTPPA